jgi:hypothetical protein
MSDVDLMVKVIPTTAELRAIEKHRISGWYSLTPTEARRVAGFLNRLADAKEST